MITNISKELKISGIYKITYEDKKVYIGQAINIYNRALEHNSKKKQKCDKVLKEQNAQISVLEKVENIKLLDKIEDKWIEYYDATNPEKGYNILKKGNAAYKKGVESPNALFTEKQLEEIINLLINRTELSYIDIAKKFHVNPQTILRISSGQNYFNSNLSYPLRSNNHDSAKKNKIEDYFQNQQELISLKEDLLYRWDLKIEKDLCKKYQIPLRIIRQINQGRLFQEYGEYNYPIRKKNIRNKNNFTQTDIQNIILDLKNPNLSMEQIGLKYKLNRNTVSKINKGEIYILKNIKYPIR